MTTKQKADTFAQSFDANAPQTIQQHRARLKYFGSVGERIAYVDEGPRNGKPIVLLHGIPTSSWLYRNIIPILTKNGLRVIAPDMLGFGASDKPADQSRYAFALQAERLRELMQSLGISNWTQVVHDLGGPWTWELIYRHPETLNGLVVLNTTAYRSGFKPPAVMKLAGGPFGGLLAFLLRNSVTGPAQIKMLLKQFVANPKKITSEVSLGYWLSMNEGTTHAFLAFARVFPWWFKQFDRYPETFRKLNIPAITIWGKYDKALDVNKLPAQFGRDLNIPLSQQYVLEAGHFLQEDQPDEIARLLTLFMQNI
jgi:haloalkane dehalogenase